MQRVFPAPQWLRLLWSIVLGYLFVVYWDPGSCVVVEDSRSQTVVPLK